MSVSITFLGGADTATGSKYLVRRGGQSLLVDCGLFQGYKQLHLRNWNPLPVASNQIDVVHGEREASDALRSRIQHELGWHAMVPEHGSTWPT